MKRALVLVILALVAGSATAAEDWWEKSGESLPSLVRQGYRVVGYSTITEQAMMATMISFRYVLQKDDKVAFCVEKVIMRGGDEPMMANCYQLRQ